jgi:hypothetical protein
MRPSKTTLFILATALIAAPTACSARSAPDEARAAPGTSKPCAEYLDAYGACMRRLSPANLGIASARTENARRALDSISDSSRLRQTCTDGLIQVQTCCR